MTSKVIHGKFEILDEIGHGGMGVIYRARQIALDRIVALKMLSANLVEDKEFRERFRQEAKIIARLAHTNVVQVYDIYDIEEKDAGFCIVMEFLEGRSLREVLRETGSLPVGRAVAVARQIAAGLAYAHSKGIIHRDVKPDNIMLLSNDLVKITDFGIAHLRGSTIHTQTGVSMGTPQFMSPEQAAGKSVDARSDLYSLAVVLYGMAAGQLPFTGDSPVAIALKHIQELPPRPSQFNPAIPPALDAIVLKGMAKRPDDRYQSAEEFRGKLERFGAAVEITTSLPGDETYVSTPIPAPIAPRAAVPEPRVTTPEGSAIPPARRRFNWAWIVATLPGLIALAIVLLVVFRLPERAPAEFRGLLRQIPFGAVLAEMRNLQIKDDEKLGRFIESYEPTLRARAEREMKALGFAKALELRDEIEEVIFPYLTPEQQQQWPAPGPGRARVGPFARRREGGERPGLPGLLNTQIEESPVPDPEIAGRAFAGAKQNMQMWENATSPALRAGLFRKTFFSFSRSVSYDPKNWLYHWEFSRFLAKGAKEGDEGPALRFALLRLAVDQATSAATLCRDPNQRRMVEMARDALIQALPAGASGKLGLTRPPIPPGAGDRTE